MPHAIDTQTTQSTVSNRRPVLSKTSIQKLPGILDGLAFVIDLEPEHHARDDFRSWLLEKPTAGTGLKGEAHHKRGSYRLGREFRTHQGGTVLIQADPYKPNYGFLRIEFNPSNSPARFCFEQEIKPIIQMILHGCLDDFLLPDNVRFTNLAFTQDYQGLYPHQFSLVGKSEAIKQYRIYTDGKETQSFYAGSDMSENQTLVYNKTAEVNKKTGKVIPQTTRFEHTYKPEGGVKFQELYSITPFKNLSVNEYPKAIQLPPEIDPGDFACIVESVKQHGIPKVLSSYTCKKRRATIKGLLTSHTPAWWNPQPGDFHPALDDLGVLLFHA